MDATERQKLLDQNRLRQAEIAEATAERQIRMARGDYDHLNPVKPTRAPPDPEPPRMTQQQKATKDWDDRLTAAIKHNNLQLADMIGVLTGERERELRRELRDEINALRTEVDALRVELNSSRKGWWK